MRIRRPPTDDAIAFAARILPAIAAAEARGEEIVLEGLPPCAIDRPVRARIEPPSAPTERIALCAACADAPACPGFYAAEDRAALSRVVRPRFRPQWETKGVLAAHFERLREMAGLRGEPLGTIERRVISWIGSAGPTTPLEFSLAWRDGRVFPYRFSCVVGSADPIQVLFGVEADRRALRVKAYAMLRDGSRMVGLDARPDGTITTKKYVRDGGPAADVHVEAAGASKAVDRALLRNDLSWSWVLPRVPDAAPLEALRASGTIVPTRFSTSTIDPRDVTVYYWVTELR